MAPVDGIKVCVVGGGSTYTPELVEGILRRRDELPVATIHLVDRVPERLAVLGPLACRMAQHAGSSTEVVWGTDRRAGIRDAAFVVSQVRVGGMAARNRDEQLGREFDVIGQETVGVGGFANALRTIPVALDIARDIAELAPEAVLLNFTNPAGLVTEALVRHSAVHTIGLCNVPWGFRMGLAHTLGVDPESIELDYVGLNHLSWVRDVVVAGTSRIGDAIESMAQRIERAAHRYPYSPGDHPRWAASTIRLLDALPNDYLLYYLETQQWLMYQRAHPTRASEVMAIEDDLMAQYRDPALCEKPKALELRGGAFYSETAAALMADIHSDSGAVHIVNVENRGAIPGLADDAVVEVPAVVGRAGARAVPTTPLRGDVESLIRTVKAFERLTIEAAVTGDVDTAKRALLVNPLGPPAHRVDELWDRLVDVHTGWLGKFDPA